MPAVAHWLSDFDSALAVGEFVRLVLSRPSEPSVAKIPVRPVTIRGERHYQWVERVDRKEVHFNLTAAETRSRVEQEFPTRFRQLNLLTTAGDFEFRASPAGEVNVKRSRASQTSVQPALHDAKKRYLIPEGRACPFLEATGVMTADGRVRASMQHKFRQINRFLEFVNDVYPDLPPDGTLRVVDFGCGKSYLTLAIHHLLAVIHLRDVEIIGIDRSADVVATCGSIVDRLGLSGVSVRQGDISTFAHEGPVHLAVSLHACDTATDAAIARAVEWDSNVILSAPCCQHEIAAKMSSAPLELVEQHGILKERFAALATDALRAAALEAAGYRTQVMEFIDLDHTAKNLLIRAVRRAQRSAESETRWRERFEQFKSLLGVSETAIEGFPPWKQP
jgi:SAM-dependent methyltransferase